MSAEKSFSPEMKWKITREGIMLLPNKAEAIKNITDPANKKQLQSFIRLIHYYRDMWRNGSGILSPLFSMTSKQAK